MTAATGAAIVAGPPVLMALAGEDAARLVDFSWPPATLVYFGCVLIGATMILDPPAPWPSMQRAPAVIRWLLAVSGWVGLVALTVLLGADARQGWLPDIVGLEPGGQPDLDSAFWPLLWALAVFVMSLMVLASTFVAALIVGRSDPAGTRPAGAGPAHGPHAGGDPRVDLR